MATDHKFTDTRNDLEIGIPLLVVSTTKTGGSFGARVTAEAERGGSLTKTSLHMSLGVSP